MSLAKGNPESNRHCLRVLAQTNVCYGSAFQYTPTIVDYRFQNVYYRSLQCLKALMLPCGSMFASLPQTSPHDGPGNYLEYLAMSPLGLTRGRERQGTCSGFVCISAAFIMCLLVELGEYPRTIGSYLSLEGPL